MISYDQRYFTNSGKLRKLARIERCAADLRHAKESFRIYAELFDQWIAAYAAFPSPGDNPLERSVDFLNREFVIMRCIFDSACIAFIRAFDATRARSPVIKRDVVKGMSPLLLETYNLIEEYRNENAGHPGRVFAHSEMTFKVSPPDTLSIVLNSFHSPGFGGKIFVKQADSLIDWIIENKIAQVYRQTLEECSKYIIGSLEMSADGDCGIPAGRFKITPNEEQLGMKYDTVAKPGLAPAVRFEHSHVRIEYDPTDFSSLRALFGVGVVPRK